MKARSLAMALLLWLLELPAGAESWRIDAAPVRAEGASAVAVAPDGRWAVGDARGVALRGRDGRWLRFGLHGSVRDLAFAADGALWIAAEEGLLRFDGQRAEARDPAPGEAGGAAQRLAIRGPLIAVATDGGVYWSRDGRRFERVDGPFGDGPASGLAWEAKGSATTLWIAAERGLLRASIPSDGPASRVRAEPIELPAAVRPALDVQVDERGVAVLGPDGLAERETSEEWRLHRLALPPGAVPARVLVAADAIWIATDRGLVAASGPAGPWRRASSPAGATPVSDLARDGDHLLAASQRGLLVGQLRPPGDPIALWPGAAACDPPIVQVHRAALASQGLGADRVARMWSGVRQRALLPVVTLDGSLGRSGGHTRSWDQTYVSGGTRDLYDRDLDDSHKRDISIRLIWDLGAAVFSDDEIDISNEERHVIALRDDVLDEVNQLYFDRRRALEAAAAAPAGSPEAASARLRADELGAGLDGWTGGWFGAAAAHCPQ